MLSLNAIAKGLVFRSHTRMLVLHSWLSVSPRTHKSRKAECSGMYCNPGIGEMETGGARWLGNLAETGHFRQSRETQYQNTLWRMTEEASQHQSLGSM